mmetsp:Transcript_62427/g.56290  ORF Transcript_62427/g.56290 Transcript_62427/m.56290 type:complete len:202 (+) Transcript_62427:54-659(+)
MLPRLLLVLSILINISYSISFYLTNRETKCLSDYLAEGELLIGEFSIDPIRREGIDDGVITTVSDPTEETVYDKNVDNGKFAFTSPENGEYVFCFKNEDDLEKTVKFNTHSGVKAKDYSDIVKKENLKPLEAKLKRLEDLARETLERYHEVRSMEDDIYNDNRGTTSNAFWFGILLTIILVGMAFWQMFHLKSFFQKKKMF